MDDVALLFQRYGVPGIALIVFAKRMGVPVPAMPFLLLAGARGAHDAAFALHVALAVCAAAVVADALWFVAGRRFGRTMLALACKLSLSPDTCIHRSELAFARRGSGAVLLAKFIPGVAGLAPPLAGALGMPATRFNILNLAGTALWTGAGIAAGWVLHREVEQVVLLLQRLGAMALPIVIGALGAYVAWLAARRVLLARAALAAPRLEPHDVAEKIARGEAVVLVDVRGPQSSVDQRIPGAIHAFPDDRFGERLADTAPQAHLVVYCDCPNDVSAARAVAILRKQGWPAQVLAGGFAAWIAAGLPVEPASGDALPEASRSPAREQAGASPVRA